MPLGTRHGAIKPDLAARPLGPLVGQKARDIDRGLRRVGDKIVADEIGRFGRLGEEVQPVGLA